MKRIDSIISNKDATQELGLTAFSQHDALQRSWTLLSAHSSSPRVASSSSWADSRDLLLDHDPSYSWSDNWKVTCS